MVRVTTTNTIIQQKNTETGRNEKKKQKGWKLNTKATKKPICKLSI